MSKSGSSKISTHDTKHNGPGSIAIRVAHFSSRFDHYLRFISDYSNSHRNDAQAPNGDAEKSLSTHSEFITTLLILSSETMGRDDFLTLLNNTINDFPISWLEADDALKQNLHAIRNTFRAFKKSEVNSTHCEKWVNMLRAAITTASDAKTATKIDQSNKDILSIVSTHPKISIRSFLHNAENNPKINNMKNILTKIHTLSEKFVVTAHTKLTAAIQHYDNAKRPSVTYHVNLIKTQIILASIQIPPESTKQIYHESYLELLDGLTILANLSPSADEDGLRMALNEVHSTYIKSLSNNSKEKKWTALLNKALQAEEAIMEENENKMDSDNVTPKYSLKYLLIATTNDTENDSPNTQTSDDSTEKRKKLEMILQNLSKALECYETALKTIGPATTAPSHTNIKEKKGSEDTKNRPLTLPSFSSSLRHTAQLFSPSDGKAVRAIARPSLPPFSRYARTLPTQGLLNKTTKPSVLTSFVSFVSSKKQRTKNFRSKSDPSPFPDGAMSSDIPGVPRPRSGPRRPRSG